MDEIKISGGTVIDTSQLQTEQVFKNYNELCKFLGIPSGLKGYQRTAQQKELRRYFDFERIGSGQKLIITDIYDTPLEKQDARKLGNSSIYVKCIELILMCFLSQQQNYTYTLTKRAWWELLGMVNHKYGRTTTEELKKVDSIITSYEINSFYQRCNKKLEEVLLSALRNLHNRKLIIYEPQTIICEKDGNKDKFHVAEDWEKKAILQVERRVLKQIYGYENIFQIYIRGQQKEYFAKINEILNKQYKWNRYFKQIKLIYNQEQLQEAIPDTKAEIEKEKLNEKIVTALNNEASEKYNKQKQKYIEDTAARWNECEDGKAPYLADLWEPPYNFVEAQRLLTKELVMIGHEKEGKKINFLSEEFLDNMKEFEDCFVTLG